MVHQGGVGVSKGSSEAEEGGPSARWARPPRVRCEVLVVRGSEESAQHRSGEGLWTGGGQSGKEGAVLFRVL